MESSSRSPGECPDNSPYKDECFKRLCLARDVPGFGDDRRSASLFLECAQSLRRLSFSLLFQPQPSGDATRDGAASEREDD